MAVTVTTILRALADLAPGPSERVLDVTRGGQPLVWLGDPALARRGAEADRLAAMDALRRDERIVRRGWGFLAGTVTVDGATRRVRVPLASEPVRLERARGGYRVVPAGDLELTPLIADRAVAARLEQAPGIGTAGWLSAPGTRAWFETVAAATGLPAATVPDDDDGRTPRPPKEGLFLYARAVLYPARDVYSVGLGDALRAWAARPGVESSALAALYGTATSAPATGSDVDGRVLSPLPLTAAQEEVVRRARAEPLTVVCGPPGSGKSHAVVAAALEVVDRGGSVLIATQSPHAADVLADLLGRYPGPDAVLFGDAERRERIATTLSQGAGVAVDLATLHRSWSAVNAGITEVNALADGIREALETERLAATGDAWAPLTVALEADAPGAFTVDVDLTAAERDLDEAAPRDGDGRWRTWRRGRAWRRARGRLRLRPDVPPERARTAIEAAKVRRAVARLAATGGTDLSASWAALAAARERLAATVGGAMRDRARGSHRWDAEARRAAGALGTALRAGRNRRREMLASMAGGAVVRALPLWVGTVTDVEDLLPPVAGLFDLVILDEASHTDQIRAAPVLARAKRALVVGDPRQLRFVSFVADLDVAATLARHGIDGRADVRRVSAYDLAAQAAPVTWLDVHFRCAPHLIGFSAERFYDGRVDLATRHPRVESTDVIEVVPVADTAVAGGAVADGVNAAEVAATVAVVRRLAADGRRDIGVVTPFRAQADALEAALMAAYPVAEIERLGLRVGTVHAFQGSEADVVVCSLAVGDGDSAGRLRFVADPTLFNVMITRARHGMVVLSSLRAPAGLLADYLAYGNAPPKPSIAAVDPGGWPGELAAQLRRLGWTVRPAYRSGRWTVDLVVGEGAEAFGLVCGVHPDGVDAHLARWSELIRSGWRLVEAYPSRWGGDPVRAALEVAPLPSP